MDDYWLLELLRENRLFVTAEIMGNDKGLPDGPFLSKPYPAPQLAKMVRDCLDAS